MVRYRLSTFYCHHNGIGSGDRGPPVRDQEDTYLKPFSIFDFLHDSFIRGAVDPPTQRIISASLFLHPGFLIVDHIHFQYNGFMFGILLWSLLYARNVSSFGPTVIKETKFVLGELTRLWAVFCSAIKFQAYLHVSCGTPFFCFWDERLT